MKVITAEEMRRLEKLAFRTHGDFYSDIFMERAGQVIAAHVEEMFHDLKLDKSVATVYLLCAKGNNSGDAYACGRYLLDKGFKVEAWQIASILQSSSLCQKNHELFLRKGGKVYGPETKPFRFGKTGLIVDGLLGTGLAGPLAAEYRLAMTQANQSRLPILAIDIPSGLPATQGLSAKASGDETPVIIKATRTVFLGLPKTGYFMGEGWDYIGELKAGDFGLQKNFIEEAKGEFTYVTTELVRPWLPPLRPSRHKYEAGTVLALAGSKGMTGAAMLSSLASLRCGAGMVFLSSPEDAQAELVCSPYELVKWPASMAMGADTQAGEQARQEWLIKSERANACLVGPGLSRAPWVGHMLRHLVPAIKVPTVLDADALNHYAEQAFDLPAATIMTPHLGELQRLLSSSSRLMVDRSLLDTCQRFVEEKQVTLILKGAVTFIFHPGETIAVSTLGNPGMATAGSGDVLTGILAGLYAQGLSSYKTALLGVALHGLAGKYARQEKTDYCLIASDLIDFLPAAFKAVLSPNP